MDRGHGGDHTLLDARFRFHTTGDGSCNVLPATHLRVAQRAEGSRPRLVAVPTGRVRRPLLFTLPVINCFGSAVGAALGVRRRRMTAAA
jgi:hypothetical protein